MADALDSGSSESNFMWVQVPSSAPRQSSKEDCFFSWSDDGDAEPTSRLAPKSHPRQDHYAVIDSAVCRANDGHPFRPSRRISGASPLFPFRLCDASSMSRTLLRRYSVASLLTSAPRQSSKEDCFFCARTTVTQNPPHGWRRNHPSVTIVMP